MSSGAIFGEIAALARVPRTATIFAETDVAMLEMRWQGLRDIRKYDEGWRRIIDKSYRGNLLAEQLIEHPVFAGLSEPDLQKVADRTLFENYGSFEWFRAYKKDRQSTAGEPAVANEGEYADGLLVVASGFARVSIKVGNGRRTLTYLRGGTCSGSMNSIPLGRAGLKCHSRRRSPRLATCMYCASPTTCSPSTCSRK